MPVADPVIGLYGDSTMIGVVLNPDGVTTSIAPNNPPAALKRLMDARFGPGRVRIDTAGLIGFHTDALMASSYRPHGISILNYGINDSQHLSLERFKANLEALNPAFYETPNPPNRLLWPFAPQNFAAYVQVMREVAAAKGVPVLDTYEYVQTVPDWQLLYSDGAHPGDEMYQLIVTNVVYRGILPTVARQLCEELTPEESGVPSLRRTAGATAP